MTNQITSDELHLLVFRYLQESGFEHSAYVFAMESMLSASNAATAEVPCGALISFVHKGLLFSQLERELGEPKRPRLTAAGSEKPLPISSDAALIVLRGHQSEVYACSFNTTDGSILASGSRDSFARIWKLNPDGTSDYRLLEHQSALKHPINQDGNAEIGESNGKGTFDVTSLSWSPDGSTLATGAFDGRIRLWNREGENIGSLIQHSGPVFAIRWSSKGTRLLSGSQDKTAIVWSFATLSVIKSFDMHQAQTLDADWRPNSGQGPDDDDDVFATCSSDKRIVICRLSSGEAMGFPAHDDEVNTVKWSHDGTLLASCSDDRTAKIWSFPTKEFSNGGSTPVCLELRGHTKEVYTVRWSPTGPGSPYPDRSRRLATASFDSMVNIWDPENGKLLQSLNRHADNVYAIEFDPSGVHIVSGGLDGLVNLWNVETGELVKSVKVGGGVFDVSWNIRGDKFAAASADGNITIVDF